MVKPFFTYDAFGRRVQRTASGAWRAYIYDVNGKVVSEAWSGGWGPGYVYLGGQLLALYGGVNTAYFIHRDPLGSARLASGMSTTVIRRFQRASTTIPMGSSSSYQTLAW